MRQCMLFAAGLVALAASLPARVSAAAVFAKTAAGHVQQNQLDLALKSQPPCDETGAMIPDGSRLISNQFTVTVSTNGTGVFGGPVRLVRPDGSLIFEARLHGTIGLGDGTSSTTAPCRAPGHIEGWLDRQPAVTGSAVVVRDVPEVRFTADAVPSAAGVVPLYQGAFLGLLGAPTLPPSVTVGTNKRAYAPREDIVFSVRNNGRETVAALNGQSYCTMIAMEHLGKNGWERVGTCNSLLPMRPVPLPPGGTVTATIPGEDGRAPGAYRGSVTVVRVNPDDSVEPLAVFFSPVFTVADVNARLMVAPGQRSYGPHQPIEAVIRNGAQPAAVANGASFCSIVQLQRRNREAWEEVAPCQSDQPTVLTTLKPGEVVKVMLPPATASAPAWTPGRYRLAVIYRAVDSGGQPVGPEILAVSEPFPVGNMVTPLGGGPARR